MMYKKGECYYLYEKDLNNQSSGIYFLYMNDVIIYIGSAKNIYKRVASHIYSNSFVFDGIKYLNCDISEMFDLEKEFILRNKPVLNKNNNPEYNMHAELFFKSFSKKAKQRNFYVGIDYVNEEWQGIRKI